MKKITGGEVEKYTSKKYTNTPFCDICKTKRCYIIVDTKYKTITSFNAPDVIQEYSNYYYSKQCQTCVPDEQYITDASINTFIQSGFTSSPLCSKCKTERTFIKIDDRGRYFSKRCASCIVNKIF